MYKIITDPMTGKPGLMIRRSADGATIPPDPENTDYAAYLQWLAEGNTADEWNPTDETPGAS